MSNTDRRPDERSPLLGDSETNGNAEANGNGETQHVSFSEDDQDDPRQWPRSRKLVNIAVIASMAILSPLASSMFTPGMRQIAESLHTSEDNVVGGVTGFVVMLGLGPLVLAPLSETFGRRKLYLVCFAIFTLLQIPTALSPDLPTLIVCRILAGFFGSIGLANGGGTINDMFVPSERAGIFGWYLLGPLLGPTLGPLFGGIVVQYLSWRWMFALLAILCAVNTTLGYFFVKETYAPTILASRCQELAKKHGGHYSFEGQDERPLYLKVAHSLTRPLKILFTQPIVFIMATYQAVIFASMYSLFTNMQSTFSAAPYHFSTLQVGLLYIGPGSGYLIAVWFLVPRIDTVYNSMTKKNNGKSKPEYRLPLANIGAFILPFTMFWFAWTIEYRLYWLVPMLSTPFLGIAQVSIFNTVQNYYIDAFSQYAASAIAAGTMFRSVVGGIVPLFVPALFRNLGYGWGWSVFGFLTVLLAPSPLLFMRYGESLRERYKVEL